ncbi:hypothetical protein DFH07DRAFT_683672, partial [Mycena maculata]
AKTRTEIIDWLSAINFFQRHADISRTRQEGTGKWFLIDSQFQSWESGSGGSLWCRGIPGAGKTVLACAHCLIIEYHLEAECWNKNIGLACIYLNHKETKIQTLPNLFSSLWRQLV